MRSYLCLWLLLALLSLLVVACSSNGDGEAESAVGTNAAAAAAEDSARTEDSPYVLFTQRWVEGLARGGVDLTDVDSIFVQVFAALPDEVTVYPSENYYYFILHADGRQIWGNIRLPAGRREHGVLSFGYFEFIEFPSASAQGVSGSKFYTDADGVIVTEVDRFTYTVRFNRKTVTFHFNQLHQRPPQGLPLGDDERFIQRTFDESGYQFYLLFNERADYFFWVLNEEGPMPDEFDAAGDDLLFGRRSGFAFWIDRERGTAKCWRAFAS